MSPLANSRFALCIVGLAALACGSPQPPDAGSSAAAAPVADHVVLVTIDTLRADHVGAYGGSVATPHLDRLAREGALFEQAVAHVPLTRPSHVALMSGLLPTRTGVRDNVSPAPIPDVPLLAEVLGEAGFDTAAFISAVVISRASGLDRGFDLYSDRFEASPRDPRFLSSAQKRGDETLAEAIAWLESKLRGPTEQPRLFLWLHLYDPHEPYEPPEPHASRYAGAPYAGEVAWTDELIGRLDTSLTDLGASDSTLLVVTSDHGEGLGDHDELLHGFFAYESTLRVPLLIRGPGIDPGVRLERVTGLVDLYPTILDLVGLEPPPEPKLSGRSVASALTDGAPAPPALLYAETLVPQLRFGWSPLRVVRDGRYKYIAAPRPELYDLATDPGELDNLADRERAVLRRLHEGLKNFPEDQEGGTDSGGAMSPELLEKLGALGYLGGSTPAVTRHPDADPKDMIGEFRIANDLMRRGLAQLHEGDFAAGVAALEQLIDRGIESSDIHRNLGRALFGVERYARAAEHFAQAAARAPGEADLWLRLAEAQLRLGDPQAALDALRTGKTQDSGSVGLYREEARILRLAGRPGEAREVLEAAVELAPRDAFLRAALSEVHRDLGEIDAAVQRLREAVELDPEGASYWNALGMMLGGTGELAEAERAFREAWRLDATDHRHAFNLGLAIVRQGRAAEARPFFASALALKPDFQPAREQLSALDVD